MALTEQEKAVRRIKKKTIEAMKELDTYKPQFDATITTYSIMRYQYDLAYRDFLESGCRITEEYTNKAGFTNIRKTATYLALEMLRGGLLEYENTLGLTPAGLKRINKSAAIAKGNSKLAEALDRYGK